MSEILYVVASFVDVLLTVLYFAIFARVISTWLPIDEDGPIVNFLYMITEPVVMPIRAVLDNFAFFQNSPLDLSTFIAMILVIGYINFPARKGIFV